LALGFGVSDEFHQAFVPGRSVEILDGVADLVGGFLGAVLSERRARAAMARSTEPAADDDGPQGLPEKPPP
jgi:VanZ family protein